MCRGNEEEVSSILLSGLSSGVLSFEAAARRLPEAGFRPAPLAASTSSANRRCSVVPGTWRARCFATPRPAPDVGVPSRRHPWRPWLRRRRGAVYISTARVRLTDISWDSMFGHQSRTRLRRGSSIVASRTVPSAHTARLLLFDFSPHINAWRMPCSNRRCFLCEQLYPIYICIPPCLFTESLINIELGG